MDSQEKKHWLQRYAKLDRAIDQKIGEAARMRARAEKVTTTFSDLPKAPGHANSREDTYVKLIEMEQEINAEIDKLADMREEIEAAINTVENLNYQLILRHRYIDGMKWEQIAALIPYDYSWVLKVHGRALKLMKIKEAEETTKESNEFIPKIIFDSAKTSH